VLRGGIAWLAFLFFVLAGWGTIVTRIAQVREPDAGLRAAPGRRRLPRGRRACCSRPGC